MANKYDLKTWVRLSLVGVASAAEDNASIGSGPATDGKTRFLTYIRVTRRASYSTAIESLLIGIGDATTTAPAASDVFAEANLKAVLDFPSATGAYGNAIPAVQEIRGSIEHPIVSVAGGTYMGVALGPGAAAGSSVGVFAQYYDE